MKIFKKRKVLKNPSLQRVPFELIVKEVFNSFKDNIICSDSTREELVDEISKRIRQQLSEQ